MSTPYISSPHDPQHMGEHVDALGLNYPVHTEHDLLSPYNSHIHSTTTSPSYHVNSTPGESISDWSEFQPSEYHSDDPFFGVDIDPSVNRVDSLSSALFNQAHQSIQHHPPHQTSNVATDTFSISEPLSASSTYPLSPIPSTSPNTPSAKESFGENRTRTTISLHELNTNIPQHYSFGPALGQFQPAQKLTPDYSGTSDSGADGDDDAATMNYDHESPRISVSQWESTHPQEYTGHDTASGRKRAASASANQVFSQVYRDHDTGSWQPDAATGQSGLGPEARKQLSSTTIPNLKEEEDQRELDKNNLEVLKWRTQSQAGSDRGDDEHLGQSYFPHPPDKNIWETHSTGHIDDDEDNVDPVDDAASIRENAYKEGQTYYNFEGKVPSGIDLRLMFQSRHWSDAPAVPRIIKDSEHFQQPATSNEAMMKWNREADAYSLNSRAATWGTRRRCSEPSLADWDAVNDGSFLKKLSISRSREPGRPRNSSIIDRGREQIAKITRKKSEIRMKRSHSAVNVMEESEVESRKNSQETLAPPPHAQYASASTSNLNSTIAAMGSMAAIGAGHTRSGSISGPTAQPKSPLLGIKSFITRARSKSDVTSQEKAHSGIAGMWQRSGGPPVAVPATVPVPQQVPNVASKPDVVKVKAAKAAKRVEVDEDDDEDDDIADEDDIKTEKEAADPIIPNYDGFKAHVRRLNPDMDPKYSWLVSRMAHQQEVRYKNLLNLRVKHEREVYNRSCPSGPHCVAMGGNATLIDAKGQPRKSDAETTGLHINTDLGNESDSNHEEGALTDETFPQGVPKPPTKTLPAEFECQLCFKTKKFQKPSDWTKHVHEDVQPFTCTYDKCKESKSFKRKADWVRHENERHRHLEWWVCQMDDCRHVCYRKDNFLQHLVREHKLPEPIQKTKAAFKKTRNTEAVWVMLDQCHHETKNRPQDEPCKFCGKTFATWKKLTVHLAKHMEHVSLPILKLVDARIVEADTIISPVEGIITPVTPIGKSGIDTSPYNLHNMSPHNMMGTGLHHVPYTPAQFYHQPAPQPFVPSQPLEYNNHNTYGNNFVSQPLEQSHGYVAEISAIAPMDHAGAFGSDDIGFSNTNMQHSGAYVSLDSSFTNSPDPVYHQFQQNSYQVPQHTMPQNFSSAPAQSNFPMPAMHNVNETGFDFGNMNLNPGHTYAQQTPMSRAHGSASSYGQSPPSNQQYHYGTHNNGHHQQ